MIRFLFPLVKYDCLLVPDKQLEKNNYKVVNDAQARENDWGENEDEDDIILVDDEAYEQVDITIPENWSELAHNDKLDCIYRIETILSNLANHFPADESELVKFSVNKSMTVYMHNIEIEQQQYRLSFQNLYEDFITIYRTSLIEVI